MNASKINELDLVALKKDLVEPKLAAGTVGTVVYKYGNSKAFDVEFVNASGVTISVMTLKPSDISPLKKDDMVYARP